MNRWRWLLMVWLCGGAIVDLQAVSSVQQSQYQAAFQKHQQATQTFQATFVQKLELEGLSQPLRGEGKIFYQAPDQMRLEFVTPRAEWLVIRGKEIWSQKPGQRIKKNSINPGNESVRLLLELFQNGLSGQESNYHTSMEKVGNDLVVTLVSRNQENHRGRPLSILSKVKINAWQIRSITVEFPQKNRLHYTFSAQKRNAPLPADCFNISP